MSRFVVLVVLVVFVVLVAAACHRDDRSSAPPAAEGACRGHGAFATLPLGPATGSSLRPRHTVSIVARDAKTGDLRGAGPSHRFSGGAAVARAAPGLGAGAAPSLV